MGGDVTGADQRAAVIRAAGQKSPATASQYMAKRRGVLSPGNEAERRRRGRRRPQCADDGRSPRRCGRGQPVRQQVRVRRRASSGVCESGRILHARRGWPSRDVALGEIIRTSARDRPFRATVMTSARDRASAPTGAASAKERGGRMVVVVPRYPKEAEPAMRRLSSVVGLEASGSEEVEDELTTQRDVGARGRADEPAPEQPRRRGERYGRWTRRTATARRE